METPILSHITAADYETVYEPAEDSFLLLDAIEAESAFLSTLAPSVCVEVGSGSGLNATAFAVAHPACCCLAVDVARRACEVTEATARANAALVQSCQADLLSCVKAGCVDVLLFNPPYVVTETLEVGKGGIASAWAGGVDGREVIDRFLPMVGEALSEQGVCYMLVIRENKPEEIAEIMAGYGFETTTVAERRAWNERLKVLKFTRRVE